MKTAARAILAAGFVVATALADPAYVGKWKVNNAKSTVTGDTVTITNGPRHDGRQH